MNTFEDHFSSASGYGRYRPGYPDELFDNLAAIAPGRRVAWDCGTGSGQVARGLRGRFERVVATDASVGQLARAPGAGGGLVFAAGRAERGPLADAAADLVAVGQALHWFDLDAFYAEARRIARPGGVLAAWTYPLFRAGGEVDAIVGRFYDETVAAFWPDERRHVDGRYARLPFPGERLTTPSFAMRAAWTLDDVMGYLGTWSAVNRYRRARGRDPLPGLRRELAGPWGRGPRTVRWELTVLAARLDG